MKARFHADAAAELEAAAAWYERERPGLGGDLLDEIAHGLDAIAATPAAWPGVPGQRSAHRFLLSRFPYSIVYVLDAGVLEFVAIAHVSRRPGYWRDRLT